MKQHGRVYHGVWPPLAKAMIGQIDPQDLSSQGISFNCVIEWTIVKRGPRGCSGFLEEKTFFDL